MGYYAQGSTEQELLEYALGIQEVRSLSQLDMLVALAKVLTFYTDLAEDELSTVGKTVIERRGGRRDE